MTNTPDKIMPDSAFSSLGDGKVAFVRPIRSDDVRRYFPQAPELAPGLELWALLGADGAPSMLTDSKAAAEANARDNDLEMVSVH